MKIGYRSLAIAIFLLLMVLGAFVAFCCLAVVLFFMFGGSPTETYQAAKSPALADYPVVLRVDPKSRTQNRRVGPPYDFTLIVNHRIPNLVKWRLLSAHLDRDDGSRISAEIRTAESRPSSHGIMSLSGVFQDGDWGKRPNLVAKIELVYESRTVREELTFPLKRHVDRSVYIP